MPPHGIVRRGNGRFELGEDFREDAVRLADDEVAADAAGHAAHDDDRSDRRIELAKPRDGIAERRPDAAEDVPCAVISFGNGIYQQNINAFIKKNSIGIIINKNNINNYLPYIDAIKKIKSDDEEEFVETNNIYIKKCKQLSEVLKLNYNHHPGEEFNKWLIYGMKNEYEDLKIFFYEKHNWIVINNFDIIIISFIIILLFFLVIILLCKNVICIFFNCCCCCSSKKSKLKNVENKIKKD